MLIPDADGDTAGTGPAASQLQHTQQAQQQQQTGKAAEPAPRAARPASPAKRGRAGKPAAATAPAAPSAADGWHQRAPRQEGEASPPRSLAQRKQQEAAGAVKEAAAAAAPAGGGRGRKRKGAAAGAEEEEQREAGAAAEPPVKKAAVSKGAAAAQRAQQAAQGAAQQEGPGKGGAGGSGEGEGAGHGEGEQSEEEENVLYVPLVVRELQEPAAAARAAGAAAAEAAGGECGGGGCALGEALWGCSARVLSGFLFAGRLFHLTLCSLLFCQPARLPGLLILFDHTLSPSIAPPASPCTLDLASFLLLCLGSPHAYPTQLAPLWPCHPSSCSLPGLPNYKAFRRKGASGGRAAPAPVLVQLVPFDAEPYQEERIDADAFLRWVGGFCWLTGSPAWQVVGCWSACLEGSLRGCLLPFQLIGWAENESRSWHIARASACPELLILVSHAAC